MSPSSLQVAAILLIAVPTVEIGGFALLRMIRSKDPGYLDNEVRRHLFRAGHAHAGVWIILALVALLYVDQAGLSGGLATAVRWAFAAGPILAPLGFFLSIVNPRSDTPNGLVNLVYLGAASVAFGAVTLGVGLLTA